MARHIASALTVLLALAASGALAQAVARSPASAPASAPVSATRKALVTKLLKLHQPALESLGRMLAEQPAQQLVMQARQAMAPMPADKRDALARALDGDLRRYLDEAVPIVRDRAVALGPVVLAPLLEQRFSEDELRQLAALLESPLNAKYQAFAAEIQRAIGNRLVADTRGAVEPKVKLLEEAVSRRVRAATAAPAASAAN